MRLPSAGLSPLCSTSGPAPLEITRAAEAARRPACVALSLHLRKREYKAVRVPTCRKHEVAAYRFRTSLRIQR